MRDIYEISEDIASNTCIMKELKNNNGNFAKAYKPFILSNKLYIFLYNFKMN